MALFYQLDGSPYFQNFNSIAATGASNTAATIPQEWEYFEAGGNLTYEAGNGSSAAAGTYSFGTTGSSDRAFGEVTGAVQSTIGAAFANNSHRHVTTVVISYTGEQWRSGAAGGTLDRLDFQYSTNATAVNNGTWTDIDALDFVTPNNTSAAGALDGNDAANRTTSIVGAFAVDLAPNDYVYIRWLPSNIAGANDGLAIDDFQLSTIGPAIPRARDFDASGSADIMWRHDNGAVSIWNSGNINAAHIVSPAGAVSSSWHLVGSGDFDGNGQSDFLWRNDDGAAQIWNAGQSGGAHTIAATGVVSNTWHISGTGDFDGDGRHDILWRHDSGAVSIWNDGDLSGAHIIAAAGVVPTSWQIAETGDFDGNGATDILWRKDDGTVSIWDNADINHAHILAAAGVVPNAWHIAGTGDFDGDKRSDILWRNDNGAVSIWDHGDIGAAHIVAAAGVVPNSWHIADVGDYGSDGKSDILWRKDDGSVSIWDDGKIENAHIVAGAGVVANEWQIM